MYSNKSARCWLQKEKEGACHSWIVVGHPLSPKTQRTAGCIDISFGFCDSLGAVQVHCRATAREGTTLFFFVITAVRQTDGHAGFCP